MVSEPSPPKKKRQGFWLTAGEIVAALGLIIAVLNFWDTRQQRHQEAHKSEAQARAAASFVVTGQASSDGRRVTITSMKSSQAIQSQRYVFPRAVLDHPMEVTAAQPQIDLGWIEDGLKKSRGLSGDGEATVPVAIATTFVDDGETRNDISLYRLGYAWRKGGLFGGVKLRLQGLALARRTLSGDGAAAVQAAWSRGG